MRSTFGALVLFLVVYIPCTLIIGLLTGSFQTPGVDRSYAYELFLWFVVAVQLFIPTLLLFLFIVLLLKLSCRYVKVPTGTIASKLTVIAMVGTTLPVAQAFVWGAHALSIDWFAVAVVPAVVLGFFMLDPISSRRDHCHE